MAQLYQAITEITELMMHYQSILLKTHWVMVEEPLPGAI
jgi:hypothetical protein